MFLYKTLGTTALNNNIIMKRKKNGRETYQRIIINLVPVQLQKNEQTKAF